MWVLLSVLMFMPTGGSTNLVNLQGKWTVGLRMSDFLTFSEYSVLWRPWKTVMIGIEGNAYLKKYDYSNDFHYRGGSVSIGLYKYFRAYSSFSPFIVLSPGFRYYEDTYNQRKQTYSVSISPGVEYFFGLMGKQLSLKFKTSLVSFSRTYAENKYVEDDMSFYLPTGGSLSTWLCFHFQP